MNKKLISLSVLLSFAATIPAGAITREEISNPAGRVVSVPANAIEVAPNVFSLGSSIDPGTGKVVEGFAIVHKKNEKARGGSGKPKGGTACYGFLASGAKWKTVEPWIMNTANVNGLASTTLFTLMNDGVSRWEDAADGIMNGGGINIMGGGSATATPLVADNASPDNVNEVYFGSIADAGAIAVTTVWGIFGGPPQGRELIEWDMVFDEVDFGWATNGDLTKMDFENIAVHELGHAFGLADLYTSACAEETMYGYGVEGETKKRTLNTGDIAGISALY